jgi:hypothetical protein
MANGTEHPAEHLRDRDQKAPDQPLPVSPAVHRAAGEGGEGGDPACWLDRVCPECGRIADTAPPVVCERCGTPVEG